MKEKLIRFMQGRYGVDSFSKAIMAVAVACMVLLVFTKQTIFHLITVILIVWVYARMLSRNIEKRYRENQQYLAKTAGLRKWFADKKYEFSIRKTHRVFTCPKCHQKTRVPKGRGKIAIRCPKCHEEFIRKS